MKKIVCTMLCIMLLFGLSACGGDVSEVKTHNVESESYSEEYGGFRLVMEPESIK